VASPTQPSTNGGPSGLSAIVVLPDDDADGYADSTITLQSNLPSTVGMAFTNNQFIFQDGINIQSMAYSPGQRTAGAITMLGQITIYQSSLNWMRHIAVSAAGNIYVTNSGDQGEACVASRPFHGGVLDFQSGGGGTPVAKGLFLVGDVVCDPVHGQCFVVEQAKYYELAAGRGKLVEVHQGDDWGFSCCASANTPYPDAAPTPDCSGVSQEPVSLDDMETPNGLELLPASWPAPYGGAAVIALEGAAGSWDSERIAIVGRDPNTGALLTGSDVGGTNTGSMTDLATGWLDAAQGHGRPTDVSLSPDGRLFVSNEITGDIFWIAPMQ